MIYLFVNFILIAKIINPIKTNVTNSILLNLTIFLISKTRKQIILYSN